MTTAPTSGPAWRKSTRSSGQDTCVEVRQDLAAVRDSKNVAGPTLRVDVASLVAHVRSGLFDA
jgi:hypothetical protein